MLFKIPDTVWVYDSESDCIVASNTIIPYIIRVINDETYCYYGNEGRYKIFSYITEAKEWAEQIHYPQKLMKYFEIIDNELPTKN